MKPFEIFPPKPQAMTSARSGIHHTADDELFWGAAHEQEAAASVPHVVAHSATRRSCDVLGLCQQRQPACPGCSHHGARHNTQHLPAGGHYFAPGVIQGGPQRRRAGLRAALRWVAAACLAAAVLASCSYSAGYMSVMLGGAL